VSCAIGYSGTAAALSCQSSGTWSDFSGCTVNDCHFPADEAGYDVNASITTFGATAIVTCAIGYSGNASDLTCQANSNWTDYEGCVINDCGVPLVTGYLIEANGTTFDAVATLSCDTSAGYLGSPDAGIVCQADSLWSNASGCAFVDCGVPVLGDGYLVSGVSTFYGSEVTVICSSGYSGASSTITCQDDGVWSDHGICTLITQPPPGSSGNSGSMIFFSSSYHLGASSVFALAVVLSAIF